MNIKKNYPKIIFALLTLTVMVIIFLFSCENSDDSSQTSGKFTQFIVKIFVKDFDNMSIQQQKSIFDLYEHLIRKLAHFTVYTALGFCSSCTVGNRKYISKKTGFVILFCFLYACSDEIHQIFVPGRAGMFTDVIIDTSGSIVGITISMLIINIILKIKSKTAHGI